MDSGPCGIAAEQTSVASEDAQWIAKQSRSRRAAIGQSPLPLLKTIVKNRLELRIAGAAGAFDANVIDVPAAGLYPGIGAEAEANLGVGLLIERTQIHLDRLPQRRAVAAPMPLEAPVTSATCRSREGEGRLRMARLPAKNLCRDN